MLNLPDQINEIEIHILAHLLIVMKIKEPELFNSIL